jgi:tetratricopeptide (TPR) repeat protein
VVSHHLACPLLWCGPPSFHVRTWELAPDFWSIRAIGHRLEAPTLPAELPRTAQPSYHDATADLLERAELERLLAAARAQHDVLNTVRIARRLARVLRLQGELGRATEILQMAKGDLDRAVIEPDLRDSLHAHIQGSRADILQVRGELDETLRIRYEDQLPVYERLGDMRERAVTLGQIAYVLATREELDKALRILREDVLPVFERLGDMHSRAITLGQIADVLAARGELDEALRIRREDQLLVYERLGDVYGRAITLGQIADVLAARGELDEALRIRREDQLPVFEKLGDRRAILVCRANMARYHLARHRRGDRAKAKRLLQAALRAAKDMELPEAERIRAIMNKNGL